MPDHNNHSQEKPSSCKGECTTAVHRHMLVIRRLHP